jgi:hypothetical protein
MKAHSDFRAYAASADSAVSRDRRPFAVARADAVPQVHNARGLVIAVSMSAACWAAIALAFLL